MTSQEGMGSNVGNESAASESAHEREEGPLWNYVTRIEKQGATGGTWKWKCTFCNELRFGSYSRVRGHLLLISGTGVACCKKVTRTQKIQMERLEEDYERRKSNRGPREVPLPCQTFSKKRKPVTSDLETSFGIRNRNILDQEISRMFFSGGLPFNLAKNPHYQRSYQFAAANSIQGYVPPSYNRLRTTLLEQERKNIEKLLEPLKQTWTERGVTIVTDGWSDPTRKPLINFMATSGSGPIFLKAVNCFGEVKDKHFIADLMKEVINEVGHRNVVQIITDNAGNCKAAGELVESVFPHIYWTPCVVHTLNLALKNICEAKTPRNGDEDQQQTFDECSWITIVYDDALAIKHFIMNHNMRLSIFSKFCTLKLLSVANTRFASIVVMLKRIKLIRRGLQAMVISDEWSTYREDDPGKAGFVKEKLLDDDWWEKVTYVIDFTASIYEMIRLCDTDKPCLHLVYEMWDSMIEKVKLEIYKKEKRELEEFSLFYDVVYNILIARWTKNNTPLHCLAHSLHPIFYSDPWLNEDRNRRGPHRDAEISRERMKCFRRLFPSEEDHRQVLDEYALFSMKSGPFGDLTSITMMSTMEPKNWWINFGAETPLLQGLALKFLGQPSSSSCCERNWSTYSFIHSLKRNRLNPSRAEDLVYIHNNLRLLSRNTDQYEEEKTKMWDVGGDSLDSMEDVGFLEYTELTLDEPDLEGEFLNEN